MKRAQRTSLACITFFMAVAAGCSKSEEAKPAPEAEQKAEAKPDDKTLKIGFIYVGPRDDFGYNQAHSEGAEAIVQAARRDDAAKRRRCPRRWTCRRPWRA